MLLKKFYAIECAHVELILTAITSPEVECGVRSIKSRAANVQNSSFQIESFEEWRKTLCRACRDCGLPLYQSTDRTKRSKIQAFVAPNEGCPFGIQFKMIGK